MKRVILPVLFLLAAFPFALRSQTAEEVVRRSEDRAKGKSSQAEMIIQTVRPDWTRELQLKAWTKGDDYTMILIQSPAREKGVAFLKRKKEIWNWVPALDRSIKLPPSMMSQSWMGTDFTNDDLVKESSIVKDYTQRFGKDSTLLGRICYQVILDPREEAGVVWSKVILWIDKKEYNLMMARYYNEEGNWQNTMITRELGVLGGRNLPKVIDMIPRDKPGQKTVMIYRSLKFDFPLKDEFFSTTQFSRLK